MPKKRRQKDNSNKNKFANQSSTDQETSTNASAHQEAKADDNSENVVGSVPNKEQECIDDGSSSLAQQTSKKHDERNNKDAQPSGQKLPGEQHTIDVVSQQRSRPTRNKKKKNFQPYRQELHQAQETICGDNWDTDRPQSQDLKHTQSSNNKSRNMDTSSYRQDYETRDSDVGKGQHSRYTEEKTHAFKNQHGDSQGEWMKNEISADTVLSIPTVGVISGSDDARKDSENFDAAWYDLRPSRSFLPSNQANLEPSTQVDQSSFQIKSFDSRNNLSFYEDNYAWDSSTQRNDYWNCPTQKSDPCHYPTQKSEPWNNPTQQSDSRNYSTQATESWNNPTQKGDSCHYPTQKSDSWNNLAQDSDSWNHSTQATGPWNNPTQVSGSWNYSTQTSDSWNSSTQNSESGNRVGRSNCRSRTSDVPTSWDNRGETQCESTEVTPKRQRQRSSLPADTHRSVDYNSPPDVNTRWQRKSDGPYPNTHTKSYGQLGKPDDSDEEFKEWAKMRNSINKIEYSKITEQQQDLFSVSAEYSLAHCVAEDMNMGSGIAVMFRKTFKQVDVLLQQKVKSGGLAVLHDKNNRYIYYLVTKRLSTGKPTYWSLWESLKVLRKHVLENGVTKLALPAIGCGLDRLDWPDVKSMLQHCFRDVDIEILVCRVEMQLSPSPQKISNCKVVHVKEPIEQIDPWTIIVYLATEDGIATSQMDALNEKFKFFGHFERSDRKLGTVIRFDKHAHYILYGCIIKTEWASPFDFISFQKCIEAIDKNNSKDKYNYVAISAIHDETDPVLTQKIVNIMRNCLHHVEVYVCGSNE